MDSKFFGFLSSILVILAALLYVTTQQYQLSIFALLVAIWTGITALRMAVDEHK